MQRSKRNFFSLRARDAVTLLDMYTRDAVTAITSEVLTRLCTCSALVHSGRSHKFRPKGTTSQARSFVFSAISIIDYRSSCGARLLRIGAFRELKM